MELPANKMAKIQQYLRQLPRSSRTTRKDLEKFTKTSMLETYKVARGPYVRNNLIYDFLNDFNMMKFMIGILIAFHL